MLNQRDVKDGLCKDCKKYEDYSAYLDAHPEERTKIAKSLKGGSVSVTGSDRAYETS